MIKRYANPLSRERISKPFLKMVRVSKECPDSTWTKQIWGSLNLLRKQGFQVSLSQSPTFYNRFIIRTEWSPFRNENHVFWFWKEMLPAKVGFSQLSTRRQAWLMVFITKVLFKGGWIGVRVCIPNENCELETLSFPEFSSAKHWKWEIYPFSASWSTLSMPGPLTAFLKM